MSPLAFTSAFPIRYVHPTSLSLALSSSSPSSSLSSVASLSRSSFITEGRRNLFLTGRRNHATLSLPVGGLGGFMNKIWRNMNDTEKHVRKRTNPTMQLAEKHTVLGTTLKGPYPSGYKLAMFGLGCFWGAERKFWQIPGVYSTSVGYAGGHTKNPTYYEVCSGTTGHAEVVRVIYDDKKVDYETLLDVFWEAHDPTTKNRQGNDVGTQYRSIVFWYDEEQKNLAENTKRRFDKVLREKGVGSVVTEIEKAPEEYYFAEDYHQQYLEKNPRGYCGLGGTGLYVPREREGAIKQVADY